MRYGRSYSACQGRVHCRNLDPLCSFPRRVSVARSGDAANRSRTYLSGRPTRAGVKEPRRTGRRVARRVGRIVRGGAPTPRVSAHARTKKPQSADHPPRYRLPCKNIRIGTVTGDVNEQSAYRRITTEYVSVHPCREGSRPPQIGVLGRFASLCFGERIRMVDVG